MTVLTLVTWLGLSGCHLACASGIAANLERESVLRPCAVSASGIGLAQWNGARRRRLLATFGKAWCDPLNQLSFIVTELREMGLLDRLWRITDPGAGARLFMAKFERPRRDDGAHRTARAWAIYHELQAAGAR